MIKINYSGKKLFILGMGSSGQRYSFLASKLIKKKILSGLGETSKTHLVKLPIKSL